MKICQVLSVIMALCVAMVESYSILAKRESTLLNGNENKAENKTKGGDKPKATEEPKMLTTTVKPTESAIDRKIKQLMEDVQNLKKLAHTVNCEFLPADVCGPCSCVDEDRLPEKYFCDCRNLPPQEDCLEFKQNGYNTSGIYKVHQNNYKSIHVFCDQDTDEGGWTVFQRRFDGGESFHRDWEMYKIGFGDLQFEHWLGNEHLHTLMLHSLYYGGSELRVELMNWDRKPRYAKYGQFEVGDEFAKYQLHVGGYTGNAGDGFSRHNKMDFSTIDRDHDLYGGSCAQRFHGGWWYAGTDCNGGAALNQEYYPIGVAFTDWYGIRWDGVHTPTQKQNLKRTEMKLRRRA